MTKMHMVAALNQALDQELARDPHVIILGEDVGIDGGVFRVTDGLFKKYGKDRVMDTPIAEAGIIGASTGLAIAGLKPVCEIQFSGFMYQGFHHIKQHLGMMRMRTYGTFTCPIVIRSPATGGIRALELHSESPEAFYVHCQGIKVVMPSGPYDAKGLLISAIRDPDPVIFLEPEKLYRSFKEEVPDEPYTIPIGTAKVIKEGKDVTVLSWGSMLRLCMDVVQQYQAADIELIDVRTLWPLDMDTILKSVKKTGRVVIVHEAPKAAGMGAELAARIQENVMLSLQAPIIRVSGLDMPFPQFALEKYYLPDANRIIRGIRKAVEF